jgi:hypothetical protein
MAAAAPSDQRRRLTPGVEVEVRARFDGRWKRGFEIAAIEDELYRIRRHSDGTVLPEPFGLADVRETR